LSSASSPFKEVINEGGEDSMSTPNMSFDSPIIVAKTNFSGVGKLKGSSEPSHSLAGDSCDATPSDSKDPKVEEEKRAKKRDMFAPEADMFAEQYSVSFLYFFSSSFFFKVNIEVAFPTVEILPAASNPWTD